MIGWETFPPPGGFGEDDEYQFYGDPPGVDVHGILVHVYDEDSGETIRIFWAYQLGDYETWDEWMAYIDSMIEGYGITE